MSTDTVKASKSAKILYRPFGLVSSMVGGLLAGQLFKQVYKRVSRAEHDESPGPLASEYPLKELLVASSSREPSTQRSRASSTVVEHAPSSAGQVSGRASDARRVTDREVTSTPGLR